MNNDNDSINNISNDNSSSQNDNSSSETNNSNTLPVIPVNNIRVFNDDRGFGSIRLNIDGITHIYNVFLPRRTLLNGTIRIEEFETNGYELHFNGTIQSSSGCTFQTGANTTYSLNDQTPLDTGTYNIRLTTRNGNIVNAQYINDYDDDTENIRVGNEYLQLDGNDEGEVLYKLLNSKRYQHKIAEMVYKKLHPFKVTKIDENKRPRSPSNGKDGKDGTSMMNLKNTIKNISLNKG